MKLIIQSNASRHKDAMVVVVLHTCIAFEAMFGFYSSQAKFAELAKHFMLLQQVEQCYRHFYLILFIFFFEVQLFCSIWEINKVLETQSLCFRLNIKNLWLNLRILWLNPRNLWLNPKNLWLNPKKNLWLNPRNLWLNPNNLWLNPRNLRLNLRNLWLNPKKND